MQLGLRGKTIALCLLCALVPLTAVASGAFYSAQKSITRFIEADLSRITRDTMERLTGFIEEAAGDLNSWSTLHAMQDVLIEDQSGSIATELKHLRDQYAHFGELLVVNSDGKVLAATRAENVGRDLSGDEVFEAVKANRPVQEPVRETDLIKARGIVFADPIHADYDQTLVIGALVGVLDWSVAEQRLRSETIAGSAQDADHLLVLIQTPDTVLYASASAGELLNAPLFRQAAGPQAVVDRTEILGKAFLHSSVSSPARAHFAGSGWILHAAVSADAAYASINELKRQFILVSALVC